MGTAFSAPAKLRQLFVLLLVLTVLLNLGSFAALMRTQKSVLQLESEVQPVLYRMQEYVSTLQRSRLEVYRYLSDYTGPEKIREAGESLGVGVAGLAATRGTASAILADEDLQALTDGAARLAKLYDLLVTTRSAERYSEQNLLQRQLEETAAAEQARADEVREKLRVRVSEESVALGRLLTTMRVVVLVSLAASLLIAMGMFYVWKRFEASILGI